MNAIRHNFGADQRVAKAGSPSIESRECSKNVLEVPVTEYDKVLSWNGLVRGLNSEGQDR